MKNEAKIAALSRKLGYGSHASHGVKAVLGKMPINMSDSRADSVLEKLQAEYDASPEGQAEQAANRQSNMSAGWAEDMPMAPNFRCR